MVDRPRDKAHGGVGSGSIYAQDVRGGVEMLLTIWALPRFAQVLHDRNIPGKSVTSPGNEWSDPKKVIALNAQWTGYDTNFILDDMEIANL